MNLFALQKWSSHPQAINELIALFGSKADRDRALSWLGAFADGDFSGLPPVITLPSECMPGLWGGYSREKNRIYISADCPPELVDEVLIEEIGHFLDRELCAQETPGEEGARFAALVLGFQPTAAELQNWQTDEGWSWVLEESEPVLVEGAKKGKKKSIRTSGGAKKSKKRFSSSTLVAAPNELPPPKMNVPSISEWEDKVTTQTFAGQTLYGNTGNDTFVVTFQDVYIIDTMGGVNSIKTSVDSLNLQNFPVTHLELTGAGNVGARGNIRANSLLGNSGNNTFNGAGGADTIDGRAGNDSLDGSGESDFISGGLGNDTVLGAEDDALLDGGADTDWLKVGANFNDASNSQIVGIENVEVTAGGLTVNFEDQSEAFAVGG